jgi:hypothetical protein
VFAVTNVDYIVVLSVLFARCDLASTRYRIEAKAAMPRKRTALSRWTRTESPALLRSDACFSMVATLGGRRSGAIAARRATAPWRWFMGRVERRLWAREVGLWPEPQGIPWNSCCLEGKGRAVLWPFSLQALRSCSPG